MCALWLGNEDGWESLKKVEVQGKSVGDRPQAQMTLGGAGGREHTKWMRREGRGRAGKVETKAKWGRKG